MDFSLKKHYIPIFFIIPIAYSLICSTTLSAQDLFTSALSEGREGGILDIGGYTRGTVFTGWDYRDKAEIKSGYGESALIMTAKPNKWGTAYADIRFKSGFFNGHRQSYLDIREAYTDIYIGKFDFRMGKQIKAWGRADAFNPTQNLTPYNYFLRSPREDDRKIGNLALTGRYSPFSFLKIELDWIPFYSPSIYQFEILDLPEFVKFKEGELPSASLDNGSFGAKADLILSQFEGSLSWFNGYDPLMGIIPGTMPQPPFTDFQVELLTKAFRQSTLGADFAVNLGSYGFRGEIAWEMPEEDELNPSVPMEEISWSIGIDRSHGKFRLIMEYYGKNIPDFESIDEPEEFNPLLMQDPANWIYLSGMLENQIRYYNRILYDQTDKWIHGILIRPSASILHETLEIEVTCLYNFTTSEYMLRPMASYQLADGIELIAGYEHFYGDNNTRFNWIKEVFNGPFAEIRISF